MVLYVIIFLIINMLYWLVLFTRLAFHRERKNEYSAGSKDKNAVQLVLCVRNEGNNLKTNLPILLNQDHPNYSVLVIDDLSDDDTSTILNELKEKCPHLSVKRNPIHLGKKRSLHQHLPMVEESILAFTDGDCQAVSSRWLSLMTRQLDDEKHIVLGYGPFFRRRTLANIFARFESVLTATQYFSYALAGIPYMGVGRNLVYKKEIFDREKGFSKHLDLASGDDDLLINQVANRKNTTIQIDPWSFMYSHAPISWRQFIRQKRRHLSTSPRYKTKHQFLLGLFALSQVLFYLGLPLIDFQTALLFWLLRYLLLYPVAFRIFRKLDAPDLILFFPFLDILLAMYYVVMSFLAIFPQRKSW